MPLIQLGTLVSSLRVISRSLTKCHLSLSLVIITFVNFIVPHLLSTFLEHLHLLL